MKDKTQNTGQRSGGGQACPSARCMLMYITQDKNGVLPVLHSVAPRSIFSKPPCKRTECTLMCVSPALRPPEPWCAMHNGGDQQRNRFAGLLLSPKAGAPQGCEKPSMQGLIRLEAAFSRSGPLCLPPFSRHVARQPCTYQTVGLVRVANDVDLSSY